MGLLFVDTGGFYAAADRSDQNHDAAAVTLRARSDDLVTSDYVLVETWLLLRARLGQDAATRYWDGLSAGAATIVGVGSADLQQARIVVRDWPDQDFSIVDCTSFAIMERLSIVDALAFDAHFRIYRFGKLRKQRFAVLP